MLPIHQLWKLSKEIFNFQLMRDLVIYGAGGYGKEVACLINAINKTDFCWNLLGFIDDGLAIGTPNAYGKVIGCGEFLHNAKAPINVVLAIGNPVIQSSIVKKVINPNIQFPNIKAPDVIFLDLTTLTLGKGNIIGFRSIISYGVTLGDFNIFNSDVIIGHEVKIGSCNVFNPSVRISGNVKIGDANLFGVSSVIIQNKKVGNCTIISPNSVIIRHTQDNKTYLGNPAIKMKF